MTDQDKLTMLKTDLGMSTDAYDDRLDLYMKAAEREIIREGVTLDNDNYGDVSLHIMYAAWLWRRRDSMEGMPRMLRYLLNNRVLSEKMQNG